MHYFWNSNITAVISTCDNHLALILRSALSSSPPYRGLVQDGEGVSRSGRIYLCCLLII